MLDFRIFIENEQYEAIPADIPLPPAVQILSKLFKKNNSSLYVVGGIVRDFLFHKMHGHEFKAKDVDLATESPPEKIVAILQSDDAQKFNIKVVPKGEAFGVISAILNGQEYEIATFREEWYDPTSGDGRRPDQVRFSTPGKDASRRDLTINALFYDIDKKEIRDYNGGLGINDIKNMTARPVGNAHERFREDKLRILRLIRFFSKFNPGSIRQHLDPDILKAVEDFKELKGISLERISSEFLTGLVKSADTVNYLKNYQELGLLPYVFPGMQPEFQGIENISNSKNPKVILAWLFRNYEPSIVRQRLNACKYPNNIVDRVVFLLQLFRFDVSQIVNYLKKRDNYKQLDVPEESKNELFQDIREFAKIAGLSRELEYFLNYNPVAKATDFPHLKGKAVGDAISNKEKENYASMANQFPDSP